MSEPKPLTEAKAQDQILCERCRSAMKVAARIEPFGGQPGLTAFECPACGAVRSFLVPARARRNHKQASG